MGIGEYDGHDSCVVFETEEGMMDCYSCYGRLVVALGEVRDAFFEISLGRLRDAIVEEHPVEVWVDEVLRVREKYFKFFDEVEKLGGVLTDIKVKADVSAGRL
jgi:hypothetical protein